MSTRSSGRAGVLKKDRRTGGFSANLVRASPRSANGMLRPCSCPAVSEPVYGRPRQGARHVPARASRRVLYALKTRAKRKKNRERMCLQGAGTNTPTCFALLFQK